eukprot:CFRG5085T1
MSAPYGADDSGSRTSVKQAAQSTQQKLPIPNQAEIDESLHDAIVGFSPAQAPMKNVQQTFSPPWVQRTQASTELQTYDSSISTEDACELNCLGSESLVTVHTQSQQDNLAPGEIASGLLTRHFESNTWSYPDALPLESVEDSSGFVGAFLCHNSSAIALIYRTLSANKWLKLVGRALTPLTIDISSDGGKSKGMAVHVSLEGALEMLKPTDRLHSEMAKLLLLTQVQYVPGYRAGLQGSQNPERVGARATEVAPFRFIELFAGIGGFRIGLEALGGKCVFSSEIDAMARATYAANFRDSEGTLAGDITEIHESDVPDHEVLTAGFPCQSFSKAGDEDGLECCKGNLFFEVIRILRAKRPRALLLENVANLLKHEKGRTLATILFQIRKIGYVVHCRAFNARALLPQQRERLFIVGFRKDDPAAGREFSWPDIPILPRCVKHILETSGDEHISTYALSDIRWNKIQRTDYYITNPKRRLVQRDSAARTLMASYKSGCMRFSEFVAPLSSNENPRFYTPRECARLQGFPENFVLDAEERNISASKRGILQAIYTQLGNAVCPPLIAAIGTSITRTLNVQLNEPTLVSSINASCKQSDMQTHPVLRLLVASTHDVDSVRLKTYWEASVARTM